jgi:hypothetical protein
MLDKEEEEKKKTIMIIYYYYYYFNKWNNFKNNCCMWLKHIQMNFDEHNFPLKAMCKIRQTVLRLKGFDDNTAYI